MLGEALPWGFVTVALLLAAGGAYALGSQRARHAAQQQLREARDESRQWAELQGGWQWQTDAAHRLLTWQAPRGVAGGTAQRSALFDLPELKQVLAGQRAFERLRLRTEAAQDGSRGWLLRGLPRYDALGRFAGFSGVAEPTDAPDRQEADAEALVPSLASHAAPALVAHDAGTGWVVRHFNPAAQLLWPQLLAGTPLIELLQTLPAPLAGAVQSKETLPPLDAEGWQLLPFGPLTSGERGLVLVQTVSPSPAADAAEPAETTSEADSFSFTVSHDLRAPIRVVEGFTRIVKEDYGRLLDRVGNDHLDRVLGAAARMNTMIDALLTLARLSTQPLARQPVNLSQLAGYVVDDLRRAAPEREAEIHIEPGLSVQGDPTLLRLVLENLIGNAWKYSARALPCTHISLHTVPHGPRFAFVVKDNGAGFDMRSSDRLFGLFQRLHSASDFPGTGVGLASVRRIIRRHGGDIWAESEPGKGAAFFFTLG